MARTELKELTERYKMKPHEENGRYAECPIPYGGTGRAPSGCCYFYTGPGETTRFHRIDCDEYWCYAAGSTLEVCLIDPEGRLRKRRLGITADAEPMLFFPKGVIFGSRCIDPEGEGTFFTCVTVPGFDYNGFELIPPDELIRLCPEAAELWE